MDIKNSVINEVIISFTDWCDKNIVSCDNIEINVDWLYIKVTILQFIDFLKQSLNHNGDKYFYYICDNVEYVINLDYIVNIEVEYE